MIARSCPRAWRISLPEKSRPTLPLNQALKDVEKLKSEVANLDLAAAAGRNGGHFFG